MIGTIALSIVSTIASGAGNPPVGTLLTSQVSAVVIIAAL